MLILSGIFYSFSFLINANLFRKELNHKKLMFDRTHDKIVNKDPVIKRNEHHKRFAGSCSQCIVL